MHSGSKETYHFGASYHELISPSVCKKSSSRYLKNHLQLGEGMKRITTPFLLMSAGASLVSMHSLQELLPWFLLSLYFSIAYSTCICLQVIAILALRACWGYKTQDIFTQAEVISYPLVSLPSYLAYDHRPPNQSDHVRGPSTLSTSFWLWVRSESSMPLYPKLLYCSVYRLAWTASPLNLVLKPSQTLHYLFWNRNCYSNTAVHPVIKLHRPSTVRGQCLQHVVC